MQEIDLFDQKIRGVFASLLRIDSTVLKEDTHLIEDLSVDSLMALELAVEIQDALGVEFSEQEIKTFTTYGAIVACAREVAERGSFGQLQSI